MYVEASFSWCEAATISFPDSSAPVCKAEMNFSGIAIAPQTPSSLQELLRCVPKHTALESQCIPFPLHFILAVSSVPSTSPAPAQAAGASVFGAWCFSLGFSHFQSAPPSYTSFCALMQLRRLTIMG